MGWYFVEVIISSKLNFAGLFCSILVVKEFTPTLIGNDAYDGLGAPSVSLVWL